jgi:hypothetical protein
VTRFTLSTLAATRIIRSMKGETEVTEMAALHNRIALVTGASRGIGRATASWRRNRTIFVEKISQYLHARLDRRGGRLC